MSVRSRIEKLESRRRHRKVVVIVGESEEDAAREAKLRSSRGELDGNTRTVIVVTGVPRLW
jgi:hypothetical protein